MSEGGIPYVCGGYGGVGSSLDELSVCHEFSYDFDEWHPSGDLPTAMDQMSFDFHPSYGLLLTGGEDSLGICANVFQVSELNV